MNPTLTLSRHHIETFLACRHRFRLRYLERLPWPSTPPSVADELALERGTQFHQIVQRALLGLDPGPETAGDGVVSAWWEGFRAFASRLPQGGRYPELALTVPVQVGANSHFLTGRFDLLVAGHRNGRPVAHIFDWKTSPPRDAQTLRRAWQTRFYLALLAEGGSALFGTPLAPEDISMTYWYAAEPDAPRVIDYASDRHRTSWAELTAIVAAMDACLESGEWPLTDDLERCRRCNYQTYDGRHEAGDPLSLDLDEDDFNPVESETLEPEWI
jgi:hypothetical protein